MKIKTSELIGPALDWAVAKSEGNVCLQYDSREGLIIRNILGWIPYRPSVAWAQGGPIIERERISLAILGDTCYCGIRHPDPMTCDYTGTGPTPLIAAMRCFTASRLGDEVDVPEELCTS